MSKLIDDDGYEILRMDQDPTTGKWKLLPLYKYNEHGSMMFREIGYDSNTKILSFEHGFTENMEKKQVEKKIIEDPQQALIEARRDYKNNYVKKSYRPGGESADIKNLMRGLKWTEKVEIAIPFGVMPKLDGFRVSARQDIKGDIIIRSSNNVLYDHLNHIRCALKELFPYLPASAEVDGELYNPMYTLYEINSIVRNTKIMHPDNGKMKAYLFDVFYQGHEPYEERYNILKNALNLMEKEREEKVEDKILLMLPLYMCYHRSEIEKYYKYFLELGHEGIIIRCLSIGAKAPADKKRAMYQSGKCNHFYKLKPFDDDEGQVIGVTEGKGKYTGCARLILKDKKGNTLTVLHHGTVEMKRNAYQEYLRDPSSYLGRFYKYRFQLENDDTTVVRHPTGVAFRDIDLPPPDE